MTQLYESAEVRLAGRNRGTLPEALRYDITPTGLHYLLIHFGVPELDAERWSLSVGGEVERELGLSLADLRAMPSVTIPVTLECAGNGRALMEPRPVSQPWSEEACSTARWTGTPLRGVLERAGLGDGVCEIVFTGADRGLQEGVDHHYARSLTVEEAMRPDVLLAYEMNGRELEPQHGHPVRLIVPGWYGMASVKWLVSIEATRVPFGGFQQMVAYRYQRSEDDVPGEAVSRMRVRGLMVPPGVAANFGARERVVPRGPQTLRGRAWSGVAEVVRVEVAVDGEWRDARLEEPMAPYAWRAWSLDWEAKPGSHELRCRATDAAGNTQPLTAGWNLQGMGNNVAQRLAVTVA